MDTSPGFPWFWVAFPLTCFALAASVGVIVAGNQFIAGAGSFWWDLGGTQSGQFLSNEQYHRITTVHRLRRVLPALSAAGIALSVWSWRRGRA
ncbi:hypothetical protein C8K36_101281 [Rhodococcus sp. OK519]|nr:hypothetical protein C8K36_101281 [Rhodococcus sp. OK519]